MHRALTGPPGDAAILDDGIGEIPTYPLLRVCREEFAAPWYFSHDKSGRFDLSAPRGSCYSASDSVGAMRETLGPDYEPGDIVAWIFWKIRVVWEIRPVPARWSKGIADLRTDGRDGIGMTNEIFSMDDYSLPQAWAEKFAEAGWEGMKVSLRDVMSPERFGVVVFGAAGPQTSEVRFETRGKQPISATTVAEFVAQTQIRVEASPVSPAALHVVS